MSAGTPGPGAARWTLLSLAVALLLVALSWWVRVEVAFSDPLFDRTEPAGMLKSDPALLHHVTAQVRAAEGLFPAELRADTRVQHPATTDLAAELTVGQELLVAWSHRALGIEWPLHVWATLLMGATASLVVLGAWGMVLELSRDARLAALAALLVAVLPASYRTIGFVLLREDLAFPLFALHLWALARAFRTGGAAAGFAAGALLGGAFFTWHATPFFLALEAAAVLGFGPSLRGLWRARRPALAFAAGALPPVLARLLLGGAGGGVDLGHVALVVGAKLRNLGQLPDDPTAVPFDARLLWQGPFSTPAPSEMLSALGLALLLLLPIGVLLARRGERRPGDGALIALAGLGLLAAWLFERTLILAALALPVAGAVALARILPARRAAAALALAAGLQVIPLAIWLHGHSLAGWYGPPGRAAEERELFAWIEEHVPEGDAVLCDFITGPAVLAFTGRRICLQPKYETDLARRKIEEFLTAFHLGDPPGLLALARDRFEARWILIDADQLWMEEMTWAAGLRRGEARTRPGTAAELFLGPDPAVGPDPARFSQLDGASVAWRSPPGARWWSRGPISRFTVLKLDGP